jgi:hypothetical protein
MIRQPVRQSSTFIRRTPYKAHRKYLLLFCILMLYWLPANRSHRYFVLPPSHIIIYHTRPLCLRRSATAYIPILYHLAFPSRTVTFILVLTIQGRKDIPCTYKPNILIPRHAFRLTCARLLILYNSLYSATEQHIMKHRVITCSRASTCDD